MTNPRYREQLPQLAKQLFLTDGGLETTLVFHDGMELPEFAAFVLLENEEGRERLREYYRQYAGIARDSGLGFVLESMTWRASSDWGEKLGYSPSQIADFNRASIELLEGIREEYPDTTMVISGCIGPRGDGYSAEISMTADEAATYHRSQIATFRDTAADMVAAFTIPYIAEALGIVRAAQAETMPVVISYTVETDGRLPSGESLWDAIERVDEDTCQAPAYYMINCAHPTHFMEALAGEEWTRRIYAVRANASMMSHAELDESTELDAGNPVQLAKEYQQLRDRLPNLRVFGGCCGTDQRHILEIGKALTGT